MSNGKDGLEKQLNGFGEKGKERSRTSLVISQAVNHSIFTSAVSPAAERVRFILGEEDDSPAPPQLFTELDELLAVDGQEMEWKETARWVGFPLPQKPCGKFLFRNSSLVVMSVLQDGLRNPQERTFMGEITFLG